jgi:hypothetical protein
VPHPYRTTGKIIALYILVFKFFESNMNCLHILISCPNLGATTATEVSLHLQHVILHAFKYF